ncbi:hypothetical protein MMC34_000429 [Xylographa carneopallida]|nr:hypothetical protein [Xylographa carneopallida]
MPAINPIAQSGFKNATSYEAHRPSYPPDAVKPFLQHLEVENVLHAHIVDLAAGTGKFTEILARRAEEYEIIAVEPHSGMREVLEKKGLKGVTVMEGTATEMPAVEAQWADAVVVAQWVPSTKWEQKMKEITWSFDDRSPRFRHNAWRTPFEDQTKDSPLTLQTADPMFSLPLGEDSVKWTVWLTKDAIWERFHTISHIANLHGDELEETRKKVYDILNNGTDVESNGKGEVAMHGLTVFGWTTAIPGAPLRNGG